MNNLRLSLVAVVLMVGQLVASGVAPLGPRYIHNHNVEHGVSLKNTGKPLFFSLFDQSRITSGHTFAFGMFSDGKNVASQSVYQNTLTYKLSAPLWLKLRWGVSGNPTTSVQQPIYQRKSMYLLSPEFEVQYQPSDNFTLRVQYSGRVNQTLAMPHVFTD